MQLVIRRANADEPAVADLIARHHADMVAHSPDGSMHALDAAALRHPSITLWCAWAGDDLVGMAALQRLDDHRAEIKSMRVDERFRGTGAGRTLLHRLVAEARIRGIETLWLETGAGAPFAPARTLYASEGFVLCEPFGGYAPDRHSTFMTRPV